MVHSLEFSGIVHMLFIHSILSSPSLGRILLDQDIHSFSPSHPPSRSFFRLSMDILDNLQDITDTATHYNRSLVPSRLSFALPDT